MNGKFVDSSGDSSGDSSVEITCEGPKNAVESFISLLVKREVAEEVEKQERNALFSRKENG